MTSTKPQINYILTQQRHEITEKERKGKQCLFHFRLASLTWAPTPCLEPEEAGSCGWTWSITTLGRVPLI